MVPLALAPLMTIINAREVSTIYSDHKAFGHEVF
jgi:hypothetical protein